ncbi:hypothetical protein CEP54_004819 [Fusarium duplospermum]|uniref:Uncharacterized protein n=1 Tax=Fusarium duplospermum TaxID=1325734 RepID=A0A428QG59_9HYPO|nr:hypothetical protein CEP54_004819 [Fusarium duplospermum]
MAAMPMKCKDGDAVFLDHDPDERSEDADDSDPSVDSTLVYVAQYPITQPYFFLA